MKRWSLTILTCLSLLVTLVVVAWWVRSRWVADTFAFSDSQADTRSLVSYAGGVHVHHVKHTSGAPTSQPTWSYEALTGKHKWEDRYGSLGTPIQWSAAGFGVVSGSTSSTLVLTLPSNTAGWTSINGGGTLTVSGNAKITSGGAAGTFNTRSLTPNVSSSVQTLSGQGLVVNSGTYSGATVITGSTITLTSAASLPTDHHLAVVIPYWFLAAVGGLFSCFWLVKSRGAWRLRRRERLG